MEKEVIITTCVNFTWLQFIEIIGSNGLYDYVEFLAEYTPSDHYDLEDMAYAVELHNIFTIMKPDYHNHIYVAQKAMAPGFEEILFTGHTAAVEVRETIRQITSATPGGDVPSFVNRRWIHDVNLFSQMDYARDVCDVVKGFIIEKVETVYNLEEIYQVEEVDFLQLGPANFPMNSGFGKSVHPDRVREVEKYAIETALRYGKCIHVEIRNAASTTCYYELGARDLALGTDLCIPKDFYKNEGDRLKGVIVG